MRWLNNVPGSNVPARRGRSASLPCSPRPRLPACRTPGILVGTPEVSGSRPSCSRTRACSSGATATTWAARPTCARGSRSCPCPPEHCCPPPHRPPLLTSIGPGHDLAAGDVQRLHVGSAGTDFIWPAAVSSAIDWSAVRGAFTVGGHLWTAMADGSMVRHDFDGEAIGTGTRPRLGTTPSGRTSRPAPASTETYLGDRPAWPSELPDVATLTYSGEGSSTPWRSRPCTSAGSTPRAASSPTPPTVVRDVAVPTTTTGMFVQGGVVLPRGRRRHPDHAGPPRPDVVGDRPSSVGQPSTGSTGAAPCSSPGSVPPFRDQRGADGHHSSALTTSDAPPSPAIPRVRTRARSHWSSAPTRSPALCPPPPRPAWPPWAAHRELDPSTAIVTMFEAVKNVSIVAREAETPHRRSRRRARRADRPRRRPDSSPRTQHRPGQPPTRPPARQPYDPGEQADTHEDHQPGRHRQRLGVDAGSAQPSNGVTTTAAAIQIPASTQRVWLTSRASGTTVETRASRQTQTTPAVGPKAAMTAEAATRPKPKPATPWDTAPTPTRSDRQPLEGSHPGARGEPRQEIGSCSRWPHGEPYSTSLSRNGRGGAPPVRGRRLRTRPRRPAAPRR